MDSCIYEGWVRHRRFEPVHNSFRNRLYLVYLDLAELDEVFAGSCLWSTERPAIAWFRRKDHFGDPRLSLAEAARQLVEARLGFRPLGPIRLLTHLRYFGIIMNPVSFWFCYGEGEDLQAIIAEVNNTPWGERYCYVLTPDQFRGEGESFSKAFHVSPFLPMDLNYHWRVTPPGKRLKVYIGNRRADDTVFDVIMQLERREICRSTLMRVLIQYPVMTLQVFAAIYRQALRLWWKRVPFFRHPEKGPRASAEPAGSSEN